MPLAIVLAVMISILSGFYAANTSSETEQTQSSSQASAIAANMVAYKAYLIDLVQYQSPDGQTPNYGSFMSYNGLASTYVASIPTAQRPSTMPWFTRMPGVDAIISDGEIYVFYVPTDQQGVQAQSGVQSALLNLTGNSLDVGTAK